MFDYQDLDLDLSLGSDRDPKLLKTLLLSLLRAWTLIVGVQKIIADPG